MEKEVRNYNIELRLDPEKGIIEGYALVFNSLSNDLGGFVEEIDRNALNGVLEKSDVLAVLNHNENTGVLARSRFNKGSLHLEVDDKGLRYWFKSGKSELHKQLAEMIERQEIESSSFAFTVAENGEKWENLGSGTYKRTITQFDRLYDVSPVYRPAYDETVVGKRSIDKLNECRSSEQQKLQEIRNTEQQQQDKLKKYYVELEKRYLNKKK